MSTDPIASMPRQAVSPVRAPAAIADQKVRPVEPAAQSRLHVRKAEQGPRLVYEFRDPETGKMLRQFPSEAALALGANYDKLV